MIFSLKEHVVVTWWRPLKWLAICHMCRVVGLPLAFFLSSVSAIRHHYHIDGKGWERPRVHPNGNNITQCENIWFASIELQILFIQYSVAPWMAVTKETKHKEECEREKCDKGQTECIDNTWQWFFAMSFTSFISAKNGDCVCLLFYLTSSWCGRITSPCAHMYICWENAKKMKTMRIWINSGKRSSEKRVYGYCNGSPGVNKGTDKQPTTPEESNKIQIKISKIATELNGMLQAIQRPKCLQPEQKGFDNLKATLRRRRRPTIRAPCAHIESNAYRVDKQIERYYNTY